MVSFVVAWLMLSIGVGLGFVLSALLRANG